MKTIEELALEAYPVKYTYDVGRKAPDRNLPLRQAFIRGAKEAGHQESAWRPLSDPPESSQLVLVWCIDEDGNEAPMLSGYADGYFDLFGLMFWKPVLWMPIPVVPADLEEKYCIL
ncbi:MAG: hypothetical protein J5775_07185 [Spirochaetales bacterium]|nr:hypothetical protein [Spirochaetales bacterium]